MKLLLSAVLLISVSDALVDDAGCQYPDQEIQAGNFIFICKNHQILGMSKVPHACKKGSVIIPVNTEKSTRGEHEHIGFVYKCVSNGHSISIEVMGCEIVDGLALRRVDVNSPTKVSDPYDESWKFTFTCISKEGRNSLSLLPI